MQNENPSANRTKRKRSLGQEHEEIVAQDDRRKLLKKAREAQGKRERVIILDECPEPKVPRVLGAILHRRFRGDNGSTACPGTA